MTSDADLGRDVADLVRDLKHFPDAVREVVLAALVQVVDDVIGRVEERDPVGHFEGYLNRRVSGVVVSKVVVRRVVAVGRVPPTGDGGGQFLNIQKCFDEVFAGQIIQDISN